MTDRQALTRERAASAAQYALLGGFASVAAGISAQGLTGFARSNMALRGPWPYLLFFALDGAAGMCAVLLARRAARDDGGLAPRLAVWGLVTASAFFNFTHAPRRPGGPEAYALMPVVAAVLFEFCLREMRARRTAQADRKLAGLRWLHPVERVRVQMDLAANEQSSAEQATRRVRIGQAARRLYQLRMALRTYDRAARPSALATARVHRAQRLAQAALTRAGFSAADMATEVLRQVQVLTMTAALARLDYTSPDDAQAAIGNLITSTVDPGAQPGIIQAKSSAPESAGAGATDRKTAAAVNGHAVGDGGGDEHHARLIAAATRIVAAATQDGSQISQAALAEKLRSQGYSISNDRLRWLSAISGLEHRRGRPPAQRVTRRARQHEEGPALAPGPVRSAPIGSPDVAQDPDPDRARTDEPVTGGQDMQPSGDPDATAAG